MITAENEMKIDATEPNAEPVQLQPRRPDLQLGPQRGKRVRGHTLAWHSQQPGWMQSLSGTALRKAMIDHINAGRDPLQGQDRRLGRGQRGVRRRRRGGRRDSNLQGTGNDWIEVAFRTARAADPAAKLCYNDYNIDTGINAKTPGVYSMVQDFKSRGVPIDCVGLADATSAPALAEQLPADAASFAALGVDVQITELDIDQARQPGEHLRRRDPRLPGRAPLHRHHRVGRARQRLVALRRQPAAVRRQRQQEGRLHLRPQRPQRGTPTQNPTTPNPDSHHARPDADHPHPDADLGAGHGLLGQLHRDTRGAPASPPASRSPTCGSAINGWTLTWAFPGNQAVDAGVEHGRHAERQPGHGEERRLQPADPQPAAPSSSGSTARTAAATRHRRASA